MRFIHAADLHIDSPLLGLDRYDGAPVERLRGATRRAFEALVDRALAEPVDLVLLAGDIYDRDWQDFHTGLFFRQQMVRLQRAAIPVFMVQGNHDAQGVISRQLELPDNVTVFSSRSPETVEIEALNLALHGRSFPDRQVEEDWVPDYPEPRVGRFNIGLLHTSLSGRPGHDPYAPTQVQTLIDKGYDYWALGHVHAREVVSETPRIVFPGNLQGRHVRETGAKGCELVTVEAGRISAEFLPLDVVRWHQVVLDLGEVDDLAAVAGCFHQQFKRLAGDDRQRLHALRVHCRGASHLADLEAVRPGTLDAAIRAAAQDLGGFDVWIEQVRSQLTRPVDRGGLLRRDDAIGELVRMVDAIAAEPAQLAELANDELSVLRERLPPEVFADDGLDLSDPDSLRALLLDAETTVLARLAASGGDRE